MRQRPDRRAGPRRRGVRAPRDPYTERLLAAVPALDPGRRRCASGRREARREPVGSDRRSTGMSGRPAPAGRSLTLRSGSGVPGRSATERNRRGKVTPFTPFGGATDNRPSRHPHVRIRSSRCEPPGQRRLPRREIGGALVRIGLLTEGGYPYATGESQTLVRPARARAHRQHEFDVYALSRSARQEAAGWVELPPPGRPGAHRAAVDRPEDARRPRRARAAAPPAGATARFAERFGGCSAAALSARPRRPRRTRSGRPATPAADGRPRRTVSPPRLYGLAELARDEGGLPGALRSEAAVRILEPPAARPAHCAGRPGRAGTDLLTVAAGSDARCGRSRWTGTTDDGLGAVDLCHADLRRRGRAAGAAGQTLLRLPAAGHRVRRTAARALPRARRTRPERAGARPARRLPRPARPPRSTARAALITPGNTHARRWQERCGADRAKLRTVHPGMDGRPLRRRRRGRSRRARGPRHPGVGRPHRARQGPDLACSTPSPRSAADEPEARLRIVGAPAEAPEARGVSRALPGTRRPALPRRGRGRARRRRQPGLLRGDRRPGRARPRRRVRRRRRRRPLQRRRGLPDQPGRGHVLRPRDGLDGRRRGRARSSAARGWSSRRATRGRSPRRAWRCCATPNGVRGWGRRRGRGRSNSSPSSRTSRHFEAFTWRSSRTARCAGTRSTRRANRCRSRTPPEALPPRPVGGRGGPRVDRPEPGRGGRRRTELGCAGGTPDRGGRGDRGLVDRGVGA